MYCIYRWLYRPEAQSTRTRRNTSTTSTPTTTNPTTNNTNDTTTATYTTNTTTTTPTKPPAAPRSTTSTTTSAHRGATSTATSVDEVVSEVVNEGEEDEVLTQPQFAPTQGQTPLGIYEFSFSFCLLCVCFLCTGGLSTCWCHFLSRTGFYTPGF